MGKERAISQSVAIGEDSGQSPASLFPYLRILALQALGPQRLARTPEPHALIENGEDVAQYNRVMSSRLVIAYALLLELVHRVIKPAADSTALDLACGPGFLTLSLAKHLSFRRVIGVDLSPTMLEAARRNAQELNLSGRAEFIAEDITRLSSFSEGQFAMTSFCNAAHHLSDLASVGHVLEKMESLTRPDGLVLLMDLARLRTKAATDLYVSTVGRDYAARGLPQFLKSFEDSMYAAWTAAELRSVLPKASGRYWYHLVPRGLPIPQLLLGLPVGRKALIERKGFPWGPKEEYVPKEMHYEWQIARRSLWMGSRFRQPPGK